MKILQINQSDKGGGAAHSAWMLYQSFGQMGHESFLAVGNKLSQEPNVMEVPNLQHRSRWEAFWEKGRVFLRSYWGKFPGSRRIISFLEEVFYLLGSPVRWRARRQGYEDFDFPGIWHLFDKGGPKPDIVHCHNLHGDYFDLRALPWLSHQYPVILNLRDAWTLSGHCAHSFDCEKWKTGCGQCPDLSIPPAVKGDRTAENWQAKKGVFEKSVLYVTAPSQWMLDKVSQSMLKPRLQKVIPNGVDLDIFHPGSQEKARTFLKLPLDCRIILFVSHFTVSNPWKDFQTMKAAFLDVAGRMKGEKIIFLSLGEKLPDEKITEECRIVYCPYVKDTTSLVYYYQAADMYLHAAKADTFPRVVTEATACGLPVVATSVGGIPEQVKDGETGFLVAPRCPQEMADKIVYLLENKGRRLDMGVKAAQWAQKEFGLKGHAETFLDWYQEVIGDWKRWSA